MNIELLKCPFCANDAHLVDNDSYPDITSYVECNKCEAMMMGNNAKNAVELWNTRFNG